MGNEASTAAVCRKSVAAEATGKPTKKYHYFLFFFNYTTLICEKKEKKYHYFLFFVEITLLSFAKKMKRNTPIFLFFLKLHYPHLQKK